MLFLPPSQRHLLRIWNYLKPKNLPGAQTYSMLSQAFMISAENGTSKMTSEVFPGIFGHGSSPNMLLPLGKHQGCRNQRVKWRFRLIILPHQHQFFIWPFHQPSRQQILPICNASSTQKSYIPNRQLKIRCKLLCDSWEQGIFVQW